MEIFSHVYYYPRKKIKVTHTIESEIMDLIDILVFPELNINLMTQLCF
jgi:hypothetical protein